MENKEITGILSGKKLLHLWIQLLLIFAVFIYSSLPILSLDSMRGAQHLLGSMTDIQDLTQDKVLGFF